LTEIDRGLLNRAGDFDAPPIFHGRAAVAAFIGDGVPAYPKRTKMPCGLAVAARYDGVSSMAYVELEMVLHGFPSVILRCSLYIHNRIVPVLVSD
jgi:hypothetical protein